VRKLRELYPMHSASQVGIAIGRSTSAVEFMAWKLALRKTARQRSESYRASMLRQPRGVVLRYAR